MHVLFSPQAMTDLQIIHDYISQRGGKRVADKYILNMYKYCLSMGTFPERGICRDDIWQGLRLVGYKRKATIATEIKNNQLRIVRIFGRGQNIELELS